MATITSASMDDPEVFRRSATGWGTLGAELTTDLPPFDATFAVAHDFYRSLPWS